MRALRELERDAGNAEFLFVSERRSTFTTAGYAKMVARAGAEAGFKFGVHPHMLKHACGYELANDGQDTRSLQGLHWATRTSSTRRAIPNYRRRGSKISDGTGCIQQPPAHFCSMPPPSSSLPQRLTIVCLNWRPESLDILRQIMRYCCIAYRQSHETQYQVGPEGPRFVRGNTERGFSGVVVES
jgi:Phage integrase family